MASVPYLIHTGGFTLASLVFFGLGFWQKRQVSWTNSVAFLISALTYLVLYESAFEGLRWLGYTLACALFSYEATRVMGKAHHRALLVTFLMGLTLFSGTLIVIYSSILILVFSIITYILALMAMFSTHRWAIWLYVAIFWTLYPIFFLFWWNLIISDLTFIWILFGLELPAKYGLAIITYYYWADEKEDDLPTYRTRR